MKKSASNFIALAAALLILLCSTAPAFASSLSAEDVLSRSAEGLVAVFRSMVEAMEDASGDFQNGPYAVDGFTDDEIIEYFMKIALEGEYGGSRGYIIKYDAPLYYSVYGKPSDEDLRVLRGLADELNKIEGFPGLYETNDPSLVNERIYFTSQRTFEMAAEILVPEGSWGYANVWFFNGGELKGTMINGYVWISEDARPQNPDRNSIICEELVQSLGLLNDTDWGIKSIFDQDRNDCDWPSELDWAVVKILYNPAIICGMNAEEAEAAAREIVSNMH